VAPRREVGGPCIGGSIEAGRTELQRQRLEEDEKVQRPRSTLAARRYVRDTRALIAQARSIVDLAGRRLNPRSTLGQFLAWAAAWAGRADPSAALRRDRCPEGRNRAVRRRVHAPTGKRRWRPRSRRRLRYSPLLRGGTIRDRRVEIAGELQCLHAVYESVLPQRFWQAKGGSLGEATQKS
jgi:hypothetical protein